jgi:hypothetical protein
VCVVKVLFSLVSLGFAFAGLRWLVWGGRGPGARSLLPVPERAGARAEGRVEVRTA